MDDRDVRLARTLEIDGEALEATLSAIERKQELPRSAALERLERLALGLSRELGGEQPVQLWMRSEAYALDGARPLDLLQKGDLDVLERVQRALENLQFG